MAKQVSSTVLFKDRTFTNGEEFVSTPITLNSAYGYFSYHCIVSGTIILCPEVSLDGTHWISVAEISLSDAQRASPLELPVSSFLRFKVKANSDGQITLLFGSV